MHFHLLEVLLPGCFLSLIKAATNYTFIIFLITTATAPTSTLTSTIASIIIILTFVAVEPRFAIVTVLGTSFLELPTLSNHKSVFFWIVILDDCAFLEI